MRLVDFRCDNCGREAEVIEAAGEEAQYDCCGTPARRLIGAPAITGTRLYGQVSLKEPMDGRRLEKHLAEKGSWIPTPHEAKEISDMTDAGIDPVQINSPPTDNVKFEKAYDTAMRMAHEQGLIKST